MQRDDRGKGRHRSMRVRPKTYSVAVYLVGAVILLQVAMLISVFWLRAMVVSVNVKPPNAQAGILPGTPSTSSHPAGAATPQPGRTAQPPEMPRLPSLEMTADHPALLRVPGVSDKLARSAP